MIRDVYIVKRDIFGTIRFLPSVHRIYSDGRAVVFTSLNERLELPLAAIAAIRQEAA